MLGHSHFGSFLKKTTATTAHDWRCVFQAAASKRRAFLFRQPISLTVFLKEPVPSVCLAEPSRFSEANYLARQLLLSDFN